MRMAQTAERPHVTRRSSSEKVELLAELAGNATMKK